MMRSALAQLSGFGERRPRLTLTLFGLLAALCALVALGLQPSTSLTTLVPSGSSDFAATQTDAEQFGGAPVAVLVREPLSDLIGSRDLGVLSELEACLGGGAVRTSQTYQAFVPVPAAQAAPYGGAQSPCGHLMATRPAQVVYGPATFLNQAVIAIWKEIRTLTSAAGQAVQDKERAAAAVARQHGLDPTQTRELIQAAGSVEQQQQYTKLMQLALQSGLSLSNLPSIQNAEFVSTVIFDATRGAYVPKARFAYLFPSTDSALIQVRLKANLTSAQQASAIHWIAAATHMPMFALGHGGRYLVSGEPVVLNDLSIALSGQVAVLLIGAVLVMGIVLLVVFRRRPRLLALALALAAAGITFGLCALAGGTLTMASIAVLPILIGLAVDYGIQFQSRASGTTTIAAAALATGTGFLVLLLSPVPMVQGFGLLLVVGVLVAFVVVLASGSAALVLADRGELAPVWLLAAARGAGELLGPLGRAASAVLRPLRGARTASVRGLAGLGAAARGAGQILLEPLPRAIRTAAPGERLALLSRRPRVVLGVGLALAALGWAVDPVTPVQSDVTKLVPSHLAALHDLSTLERVTGTSGELDVLLTGADVATPQTVAWMVGYENRIVRHFGYTEEGGCFRARVCPALSLPDLFASAGGASAGSLSQTAIDTLLGAVPPYFSQAVINARRTAASLSFGIRLMPLEEQNRVIAYMQAQLDPPPGVTARLAGLPVLASDADASLSSPGRRLLTLVAGLAAVALMLLAIFRRPRRALVPLVPIVLATGWSALMVWVIGIPLNPMSATLGALVIAISTEFSVLLTERFRRQRERGESVDIALANAYASTGKAVFASGVTAIAGFAVLIVSDVTMLRDFGIVTLIDMSVSLLGVLAVLPAVLTVAEAGLPRPAGAAGLRRTVRRERPTVAA